MLAGMHLRICWTFEIKDWFNFKTKRDLSEITKDVVVMSRTDPIEFPREDKSFR